MPSPTDKILELLKADRAIAEKATPNWHLCGGMVSGETGPTSTAGLFSDYISPLSTEQNEKNKAAAIHARNVLGSRAKALEIAINGLEAAVAKNREIINGWFRGYASEDSARDLQNSLQEVQKQIAQAMEVSSVPSEGVGE